MARRTTVFVSYSHRNKRWLERLKIHLKPYDRRGTLDLWDDTRLAPGDQWQTEVNGAIDRAAASIVLISADFLASDFVAVHELPKLLRKAERAGARIVPIFVEPCDLASHPELAAFQALNSPKRALAQITRADAERVLVSAVEAVGKILSTAPEAETGTGDSGGAKENSAASQIFDELQSATMTLSVLWGLSEGAPKHTLSELEKRLGFRSRKKAFEALNRLLAAGWVEKARTSGLTRYGLTDDGVRQLQRLAATSDGPVRRSLASR
jgi:hypothetical protein